MPSGKNIFLIVGCQRSGSTLLESIFNAHPDLLVIGEEEHASYKVLYNPASLANFKQQNILLRIPACTHMLREMIPHYPGARVLFTLRDPRNVVCSMRSLNIDGGPWIQIYGHDEIKSGLDNLPSATCLHRLSRQLYQTIESRSDYRFGALCWAVKNRYIHCYLDSPLPTKLVRYERLVSGGEPFLREICAHLRLPWSDRLLEHEKYNSGEWAQTRKGEQIHRRSLDSFRQKMTLEERRVLHELIGAEMDALGYPELFD